MAAEKVKSEIMAIGAIIELLPTLKVVPKKRIEETKTMYEVAKKAFINGFLVICLKLMN